MRLRLAGVAAFLAAALGCFLTIVFMIYTHGSSGADRNGTFLGLDGHFFCRVVAIEAISLLVVLGACSSQRSSTTPRVSLFQRWRCDHRVRHVSRRPRIAVLASRSWPGLRRYPSNGWLLP